MYRIANADPLLDQAQLGEYLNVSRSTARKLMVEGSVPIVLVRHKMLVRKSDADAYITASAVRR